MRKWPAQLASRAPQRLVGPSFLASHLRSVPRLDSPLGVGIGSPLHCHALHSRMTSSPGHHSRTHSPSISNMAALRSDWAVGVYESADST